MEEKTAVVGSVKKGWSWLGFLFAGYYYAGYGKLLQGIVMAVLSVIPIFGIAFMIYGGIKAKKELPVKEVDFKWANVGIAFGAAIVAAIALIMVKG